MVCAPVSSVIMNKHGAHISVGLGVIFCAVSLFISSMAHSVEALFGTYSIIYGFGVAMAYTPTMVIALEYFDKYLTLATGIMVAGSSVGTLVFSPITQAMLDRVGWRHAYRIHGGLILTICLFTAFLMKPNRALDLLPCPTHRRLRLL